MSAPGGYLVVDKPAGPTSHDVVARARRLLGERRVGHAGTLDPDATGVLVLGIGRATRLLRFVGDLSKCYRGEIVLGVATSTLDAAGQVVARYDMAGIGIGEAREAARQLTGDIEQVPPMVSAVKIGGRRLHSLARAGIEVPRPARRVRVEELELEETPETGVLSVRVRCSSGTYVRVLAADLGTLLGGGAHLRRLRRTSIGPFRVEEAVPLGQLAPEGVLPPAGLVAHLEAVRADGPELFWAVTHGQPLERSLLSAAGEGPYALLGSGSELLAVYELAGAGRAKPAVVLAAATAGGAAGEETPPGAPDAGGSRP